MDNNINNGIGASLFTNEESVILQNSEQQQEEEEDLEDQMRRQEELQSLIANAFDNLVFEDEHSEINSSFDSTNTSKNKSHISNDPADEYSYTDQNYKNTSLNSFEQLQVLYQARVQESQKLSTELKDIKEQFKIEQDAVKRKMLLMEAENKRVNLSLQQSQELLINKTDEINQKINEINELNTFIEDLKNSNKNFEEELSFWKMNYNELEQKVHLMEKGINKSISEKQIRSHYEQEITKLQNVLQTTHSKLTNCEHEIQALQNRIQEIEHNKEILMSEKVEVINSITKSLEESQAQNFSLLNKISSIQEEKKILENELHSKRNSSVSKHQSSIQNYEEVIATLKEELKRNLDQQIKKREEINRLEKLLKESEQNEKKLQLEITNKMTKENSEKQELIEQNKNLHQEVKKLKKYLEQLQENQSLDNSKNSYTSEKYKTKHEKYEKLKQELDNVEKHLNETLKLRDRYITCEQQCVNLQETIAELNSKLSESQFMITTLKEKVALKEERDDIIETLKKKAQMFEEYMAQSSHVLTKNVSMNTSNHCVETFDNFTQTDLEYDVQKIIAFKTKQIQILFDENKSLKDKILFDRNSFTELSAAWTNETKKLNSTLHSTIAQNEELFKKYNEIKKENYQKQLLCDILNTKINQAKEYINIIEMTNTRHSKHVTLEHEQLKANYENVLGMIQARLNRCINVTNVNGM